MLIADKLVEIVVKISAYGTSGQLTVSGRTLLEQPAGTYI
jgi:hypothetical protein